tara:strand:+ start:196 stop:519 length:324 start_codon:yes stop_codon:yes gene_type:complete
MTVNESDVQMVIQKARAMAAGLEDIYTDITKLDRMFDARDFLSAPTVVNLPDEEKMELLGLYTVMRQLRVLLEGDIEALDPTGDPFNPAPTGVVKPGTIWLAPYANF